MKTSELTGALLDYWVARAEGFVWARNMVKRSGDSYRQPGEPERWPIGARFLIAPNSGKGLNADTPNWDGWVAADMSEPVAPAWSQGIPRYSTDWAQGGPIVERESGTFQRHLPLGSGYTAFMGCEGVAFGPTHLVAAMRAYVASKFGDTVPDEAAA